MAANLTPYLNFREGALEVMEFYRGVLGGELTSMTFGQVGMTGPDEDKTMHSQLEVGPGLTLMASDAPESMIADDPRNGQLALSGGADEAEQLRGWFDGLAEGGTVDQPLQQAPWGDSFGMCTDRFGVRWMVNISGA